MLPLPIIMPVAFAILYVVVGALVGLLSGWLTARICKRKPRPKADAILGGAGFLFAFITAAVVPWRTNTISYELSGGTHVSSTMDRYQHPERVAADGAIMLPVLYEVRRRK